MSVREHPAGLLSAADRATPATPVGTTPSDPGLPAPRSDRSLQVLAHSAALRTALRRALNAAGAPLRFKGGTPGSAAACTGLVDVIVLDTDLPGSDGFALLKQIAASHPDVPIYAVAADRGKGAALRREAREAGAAGLFLKPEGDHPGAFRKIAEEIVEAATRAVTSGRPAPIPAVRTRRPSLTGARPQILIVGSSTGGPQALMTLFSRLPPARLPVPVLIVQHMPPAFTPILAQHLTRSTDWTAREARHDEPLTGGEIRIAPGGFHLTIAADRSERRLVLSEDPPVNFCRPSADALFVSAAQVFGRSVLAVILTGMGNDGCEGAKAVAASGGIVLAQDEATSVVWGMPGAAVHAGVVSEVHPLDAIAPAIANLAAGQ